MVKLCSQKEQVGSNEVSVISAGSNGSLFLTLIIKEILKCYPKKYLKLRTVLCEVQWDGNFPLYKRFKFHSFFLKIGFLF